MRTFLGAIALVGMALALPAGARAQDSTKATTVEAAAGTSVADKALVGAAESFPIGTAAVVCFTRITGAANSEIDHVWYKGDTEVTRVKLAVSGSPFRTWTRKSMPADAAGDWRCDVVHAGKVLTSVKFKIE